MNSGIESRAEFYLEYLLPDVVLSLLCWVVERRVVILTGREKEEEGVWGLGI